MLDDFFKPDKDVIIQVWKGNDTDPWEPYMEVMFSMFLSQIFLTVIISWIESDKGGISSVVIVLLVLKLYKLW